MPHVLVKLASGHSDAEKTALTRRIVDAVTASLGSAEGEVSVALEDVAAEEWMDAVYAPDIAGREALLTKRPGYGSLA